MLALGEDEAAEVMKFLGPREVQKLGAAMAAMKAVQHEELEKVLASFIEKTEEHTRPSASTRTNTSAPC